MIKFFYGDDRIRAEGAIKKFLGENYEVLEGSEVQTADLPSIFRGASLFAEKRAILIKDLGENKDVLELVGGFTDTPHDVAIFESKLDKRTNFYKEIKDKVEIAEFKLVEPVDTKAVFDIFNVAKRDGARAVKMLEKIEDKQDPFMFFGLLVSQATKDFQYRQGTKEKRVLLELSKLDMQMKSESSIQPFSLLKSFLLQVSLL